MNVSDLKAALDAAGVAYPAGARKADLEALHAAQAAVYVVAVDNLVGHALGDTITVDDVDGPDRLARLVARGAVTPTNNQTPEGE